MPTLTLSVGPNGEPQWFSFNDSTKFSIGEEEVLKPIKIRPLVVLALFTAQIRQQNGDETLCPLLSDTSPHAAKRLGEALCNNKNYWIQSSTNHRGRDKRILNEDHWLVKIFGVPPLKEYLTGSRSKGNEEASFKPEVQIKILIDEKDIKIGDTKFSWFLVNNKQGVFSSKRKIAITLHLNQNGDRPECQISSDFCHGSFTNETIFWIEATANFPTHLSIFWACSDHQCFGFRPSIGAKFRSECKESNTGKQVLEIAKNQVMRIKAPVGNQVCILLTSANPITEARGVVILSKISKTIPPQYLKNTLPAPTLAKFALNAGEKKRGIEIQDIVVADWRDELAENLSGLAKIMYIFSIPHE